MQQNWGFHRRGWFGTVCLVPFFLWAVFSPPWVGNGSWLALAGDTLGWMLFVAGYALRFWTALYLETPRQRALASEGPYSMCRNPRYLGSLLVGLAAVCFLKNPFFLIAVALATAGYALLTIPAEERSLREKLGDDYLRYCERVPRFFPRINLFQASPVVEVKVKGIHREFKRLAVALLFPMLLQTLSHLRGQPWWPYWFSWQ